MATLIYLDNNATTAVAPEVREAMLPYLTECYANPSSMYSFAGTAARALATAREQIAALLGAEPSEILITSCGTESDATAFWAALNAQPEKRRIITSQVEHPAVREAARYWEHQGYTVIWLPVDQRGRIDMQAYEAALTPDTALVSIMFANNETGNLHPIEAMASLAHERGILFHTDAVQAVGKVPINLHTLPVDLLSLSGHKLHAPKGIGVLYVRTGTPFRPFLRGGHQERGRRGGTENMASIVGLGVACDLALTHQHEEQQVAALRDRLESGLVTSIPQSRVNGDPEHRLPNTTNISFKNVEGEAVLLRLDRLNICASSGSACTSGSLEPSHVLRSMQVPFTYAHGSIRLSLSRYTREEEIDRTLEVFPEVIASLRKLSPFKD